MPQPIKALPPLTDAQRINPSYQRFREELDAQIKAFNESQEELKYDSLLDEPAQQAHLERLKTNQLQVEQTLAAIVEKIIQKPDATEIPPGAEKGLEYAKQSAQVVKALMEDGAVNPVPQFNSVKKAVDSPVNSVKKAEDSLVNNPKIIKKPPNSTQEQDENPNYNAFREALDERIKAFNESQVLFDYYPRDKLTNSEQKDLWAELQKNQLRVKECLEAQVENIARNPRNMTIPPSAMNEIEYAKQSAEAVTALLIKGNVKAVPHYMKAAKQAAEKGVAAIDKAPDGKEKWSNTKKLLAAIVIGCALVIAVALLCFFFPPAGAVLAAIGTHTIGAAATAKVSSAGAAAIHAVGTTAVNAVVSAAHTVGHAVGTTAMKATAPIPFIPHTATAAAVVCATGATAVVGATGIAMKKAYNKIVGKTNPSEGNKTPEKPTNTNDTPRRK
ncbi:MAG: hypothetical protein NTW08_01860 [Gammaproteobacteria bacterium]|nr:hypothetical protein [Gammaproteobacteria bacterium]